MSNDTTNSKRPTHTAYSVRGPTAGRGEQVASDWNRVGVSRVGAQGRRGLRHRPGGSPGFGARGMIPQEQAEVRDRPIRA